MYKKTMAVCLMAAVLLCGSVPAFSADRISPQMKGLMDAPRYAQSFWGVLVSDLKSGRTVYALNADKLFRPASTTKLFTMAAGLDALGASHRFVTPVYRRGKLKADGELDGDLILVASGDLTLGGRTDKQGHIAYTRVDHTDAFMDGPLSAVLTKEDPLAGLKELARQVAASGVKRVRGQVIIDDRLFQTSRSQGGMVRTPIIVNDNVIDLVITPTDPGKLALIQWRPVTECFHVDAKVMTVAAKGEPQIQVHSPRPGTIVIRGTIPAGSRPSIRDHEVEDPASFARALFIEALWRAGVRVEASPLSKNPAKLLPDRDAYRHMTKVAEFKSPPYSETLKLVLKVSHNLGAEITPLLIAAKAGKRTFEDGLWLERGLFKRAGIDMKRISISDGEGLVPSDLLTPRAVVQLLRYMSTRPDFKAYHDALPILGVDGSLATAVPADSPVRGKVQAKTGTLPDTDFLSQRTILLAKGLAGYMTAASGRRLAFALYVNNVLVNNISQVFAVGDDLGRLCEIIYREN